MSITIRVSGDSASANIIYNSEGAAIDSTPSPFVENELTALINWGLKHYNLPLLLENVSLKTTPELPPSEIVGSYEGYDIMDPNNLAYANFAADGTNSFWNASGDLLLDPYYNGRLNTFSNNGNYVIAIENGSPEWFIEHLSLYYPNVLQSISKWIIVFIFDTVNHTYKTIYLYQDAVGIPEPGGIITFLNNPAIYYNSLILGNASEGTISKGTATKMNTTIPWTKTNPTTY